MTRGLARMNKLALAALAVILGLACGSGPTSPYNPPPPPPPPPPVLQAHFVMTSFIFQSAFGNAEIHGTAKNDGQGRANMISLVFQETGYSGELIGYAGVEWENPLHSTPNIWPRLDPDESHNFSGHSDLPTWDSIKQINWTLRWTDTAGASQMQTGMVLK